MQELLLELHEDATRGSLVAQLEAAVGSDQARRCQEAAASAGVPERHHHDLADVLGTIEQLKVSARVKELMARVYGVLNAAEANVHGVPQDQAHFHEVGKGMTVREILGICTAFELLAPEHVSCSPVQVGSGTVECSHGTLDIPAPATAAIIEAYGIPVAATRLEGELCTPTSAAILAHFVDSYS